MSVSTWVDVDGVLHVNDISLSSGQIAMSSGKAAHATIIECALRTRLGELPLDTEQGIPYFDTVFQSSRQIPSFEADLRARIEELPFVEEVGDLDTEFDREKGVLRYSVTVVTNDGDEVSVSGGIGDKAYLDEIVLPEGGMTMQNLVQDGKFYLPVRIEDGVQKYRMLTDSYDPDNGVQPAISEEVYKKNAATGKFEEVPE